MVQSALITAATFLLLFLPDLALDYWSSSSIGLSSIAVELRRLSAAPHIEWGRVSVPISATTSYDEKCDIASAKFTLHNSNLLNEQGIDSFSIASGIGACRFAVYLLKLVLAWVTPPELPMKEVWQWDEDTEQDDDDPCTNMMFDTLRDPEFGSMGYSAAEVLVPPAFSEKTSTFLQVKLSQAAKKAGIMMPWSTQCQSAIYIGQILQGIAELALTFVHSLRFFISIDMWFLTFRMEIFGPIVYAVSRSLISMLTLNSLCPLQVQWAWYPWSLGVVTLVQAFKNVVMVLLAVCLALLVVPFGPCLVISLAPGVIVGFTLSCCLGWSRSRQTGSGAEDDGAGLLVLKSPLVLAGVALTSLVWFPIVSALAKRALTSQTYLCSFSHIAVFKFTLDSAVEYVLMVAALTCLIILVYVVLRCMNDHVFKITQAIAHFLWVARCLSSSSVDDLQKEELQRALLVMKAKCADEDFSDQEFKAQFVCTEAQAKQMVTYLDDSNETVRCAAIKLLGRHASATAKSPEIKEPLTLKSVGAAQRIKSIMLTKDGEERRVALDVLNENLIPIPEEYRNQEFHRAQEFKTARQWGGVCDHMINVIECGGALSKEERDLLELGFANYTIRRKNACTQMRKSDRQESQPILKHIMRNEGEIRNMSAKAVQIARDMLERDMDAEGKVFFKSFKGRYHMYMDALGGDRDNCEEGMKEFREASALAKQTLPSTHMLRKRLEGPPDASKVTRLDQMVGNVRKWTQRENHESEHDDDQAHCAHEGHVGTATAAES